MNIIRIIKTEPALITGLVQAVLALVVATGAHLTTDQMGALLTATTAVLALVAAASTRPFQVASLTGALTAVGTALVAFGVHHISPGEIASVNAVVVALAALLLRGHVSPAASVREAAPAKM